MNMITLGQYCTRPHGTQCTRCQTACPHGAISFSQEGLPVIDNYYGLGVNKWSRTQYFSGSDGVPHNTAGRELLAAHIAQALW